MNSLLISALVGLSFAGLSIAVWTLLPEAWSGHRQKFQTSLDRRLSGAFLFLDANRLLWAYWATVLLVAFAAWHWSGRWLPALVAVLLLAVMPRVALKWILRRRAKALRLQLPEIGLLVAGALKAGRSLNDALSITASEIANPGRQEFGLLLRELRMGSSIDAAMARFEQRFPLEELRLFGVALRVSAASGGNLAETLEKLADALRRKMAIEGRMEALTAQGRLQAWVVGLLPAMMIVALSQIQPDLLEPLFFTAAGRIACLAILVLEGLGVLMIRRIVRIDV